MSLKQKFKDSLKLTLVGNAVMWGLSVPVTIGGLLYLADRHEGQISTISNCIDKRIAKKTCTAPEQAALDSFIPDFRKAVDAGTALVLIPTIFAVARYDRKLEQKRKNKEMKQ